MATRYELVSFEKEPGEDGILTVRVHYTPGFIAGIFGCLPSTREEQYLGDCTVWHALPGCERCDTDMEWTLTHLWTQWRYRERVARKMKETDSG